MTIKQTVTAILLALVFVNPATAQAPQDSTRVDIGYGRGNAKTTAGAVEKVTQERMNKGLVNSSLDALSGQAAGVQVQTGGN